jgi:hypothetical protein
VATQVELRLNVLKAVVISPVSGQRLFRCVLLLLLKGTKKQYMQCTWYTNRRMRQPRSILTFMINTQYEHLARNLYLQVLYVILIRPDEA